MNLNNIFDYLGLLPSFIAFISLITTIIVSGFKFFFNMNHNQKKREVKEIVKNSLLFLSLSLTIIVILLLSSMNFITQHQSSWDSFQDKSEVIYLLLIMYIGTAAFVSFCIVTLFLNSRTYLYIILEEKGKVNKYKVISKLTEQNITTILLEDSKDRNITYEEAFDLTKQRLTFESVNEKPLEKDLEIIHSKAPTWLKTVLILTLIFLFFVCVVFLFSTGQDFYNFFNDLGEFSIPVFIIFSVISLNAMIPAAASILFIIKFLKWENDFRRLTMNSFKALVADKTDEDTEMSIKNLNIDDLSEGDVLIDVHYSSVNYKDGMVAAKGEIAEYFPIIPGIDLAGEVIESSNDKFKKGDSVIATSYKIGTGISGGFSEVARIPAEYVVPLPDGLTLKESMELGTAGFTAGISISKLEQAGVTPDNGEVLVAGASGGAGSLSISILAALGYDVVASTGSMDEKDYLTSLGAKKVIHRDDVTNQDDKPVAKPQYQAAIDPVGGKTTEYIIKSLKPEGALATFGLVGGIEVNTTVLPFIGRGIHWLGVDSVFYPMEQRIKVWDRLAKDLKPQILDKDVVNEVSLEELPQILYDIIDGKVRGRTIVNLKNS